MSTTKKEEKTIQMRKNKPDAGKTAKKSGHTAKAGSAAKARQKSEKTAAPVTKTGRSAGRKHHNKKTPQPHTAAAKNRPSKKRRKKTLWQKLWLPGAAACLLLGFVLWYFSFDNLQPSDYIDITYSGYDSRGTASLSIQETEEYASFLEDAQIRLLSENGNLKNGDLLEVHFLYDEEEARDQKLRIKEDSFQIEVNGLPEGKELSEETIFQDVRITYEGVAPELSLVLSNESTDPFLQTVVYEIQDQKSCYDVGDTFLVTATFSEEDAVSYEYAVTASVDYTREFTIDQADRYLRDTSQLTGEQIQVLNETASSLFGDATEYGLRIFSEANLMPIWVNGKTTFKWSNPRLISAYLNVLKPEYFETANSHNNDIKLVYMATLSQADGVACDAEVVVQFNNLIQKADGTYDLALDSGRIIAASYRNSHIRDLVTDTYDQEYQAEKLSLS